MEGAHLARNCGHPLEPKSSLQPTINKLLFPHSHLLTTWESLGTDLSPVELPDENTAQPITQLQPYVRSEQKTKSCCAQTFHQLWWKLKVFWAKCGFCEHWQRGIAWGSSFYGWLFTFPCFYLPHRYSALRLAMEIPWWMRLMCPALVEITIQGSLFKEPNEAGIFQFPRLGFIQAWYLVPWCFVEKHSGVAELLTCAQSLTPCSLYFPQSDISLENIYACTHTTHKQNIVEQQSQFKMSIKCCLKE